MKVYQYIDFSFPTDKFRPFLKRAIVGGGLLASMLNPAYALNREGADKISDHPRTVFNIENTLAPITDANGETAYAPLSPEDQTAVDELTENIIGIPYKDKESFRQALYDKADHDALQLEKKFDKSNGVVDKAKRILSRLSGKSYKHMHPLKLGFGDGWHYYEDTETPLPNGNWEVESHEINQNPELSKIQDEDNNLQEVYNRLLKRKYDNEGE